MHRGDGRRLLSAGAAGRRLGEPPLAAQLAREVVELEPFRETGWQRLLGARAEGGNRAEALRAYAAGQKLLAEESAWRPRPRPRRSPRHRGHPHDGKARGIHWGMPILWRAQMTVGNDLIDGDHRYLLCLVNTVELALRTREGRAMLPTALEQLTQYTTDHFRREEAIQLEIGYPHYGEHRAEHRRLVRRLEELSEQILAAPTPAVEDEISEAEDRLIVLLREWILHHVLTMDLGMKPYLETRPRNFAAT
jgi:hemerythrin